MSDKQRIKNKLAKEKKELREYKQKLKQLTNVILMKQGSINTLEEILKEEDQSNG